MTDILTLPILQKMWPHGDKTVPGLLEGMAATAPAVFAKYGIATPLVVALMFGQFSEETGDGVDMVESILYSPARACQIWPSRFSSVNDVYAKVGSYPGDPQFDVKLIDDVYGGRMGNRPGTHDGSTYIGRGLSQCTGHGNGTVKNAAGVVIERPSGYAGVAEVTGLDVINHPEIFIAPATALECGIADFILCGCLPYARAGNVLDVTEKLNGGTIGLASRESMTAAWKMELGV